jgi:Ser/Thr protein kinase RdoA (MazF antagonist)
MQRVHGDCHLGNILWNEWSVVRDFDDCLGSCGAGHVMFCSGTARSSGRWATLLDSYEQFAHFDASELRWSSRCGPCAC